MTLCPPRPASPQQRSETLSEDLDGDIADLDDDGIEMDDLSADAQIFTFHKTNHAVEDTEGTNMAVDMGHLHTHGQGVGDYHSAVDSRGLNTGPGGGGWARGLKNTHTPDFARLTHDDSYTSDAESEAVVKKMRYVKDFPAFLWVFFWLVCLLLEFFGRGGGGWGENICSISGDKLCRYCKML